MFSYSDWCLAAFFLEAAMQREEILEFWLDVWGPLSEDKRREFLDRPELTQLVRLNESAVRFAIAEKRKLAAITEFALRSAWWFDGNDCEGDSLPFCARCKPTTFPTVVFATEGWSSAFHRLPNCQALKSGQGRVAQSGGEPAEVKSVHVQVAMGRGLLPCLACFRGKK